MARTLAGAVVRLHVLHERTGPLPHLHESLGLEVVVGLHDRGGVHAQPGSELAHRWERVARPELGGNDRDADALRDLGVEWSWAAGIDLVEHGFLLTVLLLRYSTTIGVICQENQLSRSGETG